MKRVEPPSKEDNPPKRVDTSDSKAKKRKVALLLGYNGAGYSGMQINPGVQTIELVLEDAIYRAGGISEDNHASMSKVGWQRAARTDKNVSAAGQVVSLKIFYMIPSPGIIERINKELPPEIRVYDYIRTTKGFNAKGECSGRKYEYLLPTFAVTERCRTTCAPLVPVDAPAPPKEWESLPVVEDSVWKGHRGKSRKMTAEDREEERKIRRDRAKMRHLQMRQHLWAAETLLAKKEDGGTSMVWPPPWDEEQKNRLNAILKLYEGSHKFHSFTSGVSSKSETARRFIVSFEAKETVKLHGIEFVRLVVQGQSFMIHQIRKMVGLAVAIMRGAAPLHMIQVAYQFENVPMPKAPGMGLMLGECLFEEYNKYKLVGDRDPVTFSVPHIHAAMEKMRTEVVYEGMAQHEESVMKEESGDEGVRNWVRHVDDYQPDREARWKEWKEWVNEQREEWLVDEKSIE